MNKTLLLSAAFVAMVAAAQAAEPTNSGTSSYLAQAIRVCNGSVDPVERESCKAAARKEGQANRADRSLPTNWAQDRWR